MPASSEIPTTAARVGARLAILGRFRTVAILSTLSILLIPSLAGAEELPCADCHEKLPDPEQFAESVHGGLGCVDCHTAAEDFPHSEGIDRVDCAMCHDDEAREYQSSVHGQARINGETEAPGCESCHGDPHVIVPTDDPRSPVHPLRLPDTCGTCHANPEIVEKFGIPVAKPIEAYHQSVHFRKNEEGEHAATCNSCHGTHALYAASDPRSKVFHANVPRTCGQCHEQITEVFEKSVHGRAAAHGAREAPVCTDCHGEHQILGPDVENSPVFASNIPRMVCGRCHGDLRLARKYDLPTEAVTAYRDSYHGLASRAGNLTVANCASCHGVHDILPSSDPASHTNPANLAQTCGSCHPGAGTRFTIGTVHKLATEKEFAVVYWIRWIYLWLIWTTIGGMLVHNGLDFYRKLRNPFVRPLPGSVPRRMRMTFGFRLAHGLLIVSFATLVYSGFALKFPESWWAAPLLRWEGEVAFRGWVHRAAALVLIGAFLYHLVHLVIDRRARSCIAGMRPTWHDVTELRERLQWFFGMRRDPPRSPKLGYPEKMEYIALMWGTVVMAITGFALWFENTLLRLFPSWFADVATVIHFYEAILATLAILVWHFYFVIFDPVVYPMDTSWLTGREPAGRAAEREDEDHTEPTGVMAKGTEPPSRGPVTGSKRRPVES